MKKVVKELDTQQQEFDVKQKSLIEACVTPADAILITSQNKIQRVVDQCRRSHGGPISEEFEVEDILKKFPDEKAKKAALVLEVRYRKFTVLNIKESNPLFKQQNLSVEQLVTNLKLLLQKTDLALASTATMVDLEKALSVDNSTSEGDTCSPQPASTEDRLSSSWPPIIGEHVVVNFEDGWCVSEVKSVDEINASVEVSCMKVNQEHILPICSGSCQATFY